MFRNVLTLAGGIASAQAINVLALPFLTRLYAPYDYGILATVTAITAILNVFCTLKYEHAIIAINSDKEARRCVYLVLLSSLSVSFIIAMGGMILGKTGMFHIEHYYSIVFISSLIVVSSSWYQAIYYWNNRFGNYRVMTRGRVLGAIAGSSFVLLYGLIHADYIGLLCGSVLVPAVNFFFLYKKGIILTDGRLPSLKQIYRVARKHSRFPRYLVLSNSLDRISSKIHIMFFAQYFGSVPVGSLGLYNRVVGFPVSIIGNSVGDVFKKEARESLGTRKCQYLFGKTALSLFAMGFLPAMVLLIWGPELFLMAFGRKWTQAGEFARILSIMFLFSFVVSPLSTVVYLGQNQKYDFYLQVGLLVSLVAGLGIAVSYCSIYWAIGTYGFIYCVKYIVQFLISSLIASGKVRSDIKIQKPF